MKRTSVLLGCGAVLLSTALVTAGVSSLPGDAPAAAARGLRAFFDQDLVGLGGNGRSCADCHMPTDQFQLSPASAEARFQRLQLRRQDDPDADDPLFRPIDADDFRVNGDSASDFSTLREHGVIRITMPLPSNVKLIDPATNLPSGETFVDVWRSVPTVNDVAITGPDAEEQNTWPRDPNRFGGYQLDARVGTLEEQALGALVNHAQIQSLPSPQILDDLASFQRVLFTNPRVRALSAAMAAGAETLPDTDLPLDAVEQQGKVVFERACAQCHAGPSQSNARAPLPRYHDIVSQCPRPVDPQQRFVFAECAPLLARNVRTYAITTVTPTGTTTVRRTTSDPGRGLLTGFVGGPAPRDDWNKFDMPTLRGISRTAPFFHNNSAATLEDVVDHYIEFFKRVEANFVVGTPIPPVATTDGVHFDRRPTLDERAALLAYLRKQ